MSIGLYDDVQKLRGKSSAGLGAKGKLAAQCAVATVLCAWLAHGPLSAPPTAVTFAGAFAALPLGRWFWALAAFAMVAESNAVNVTDGLDGLAASTAAVALVGTGLSLLAAGRGELAAFAICMVGPCRLTP